MSRTVYVNGEFLPEEAAKVSVFDRGFLFADAVYEVTSVLDGKLLDFEAHTQRLERSLRELDMSTPCSKDQLLAIHRRLIEANRLSDGVIYLQVSRGVADRDFVFPVGATPTLVVFTQSKPGLANSPQSKAGIKVVSIPDLRWRRRDIKTVQLLYPSMGKMMAKAAGADDAWMVEQGVVTEGTANNAYIVTDGGKIVTRQLGTEILHGITRAAVLRLAAEVRMEIEERPFSIEEAKAAAEAFITSASTFVMPVIEIDGVTLGNGQPGPISKRLREIYLEESRRTAI